MAEPQPSTVQEGAADPHAPTGTADDRKAAAALSTLDAPQEGENGPKKEVDGKALDKAMKGLNVKDKKEGEKKNVKIEAADVNLLVRSPWNRCAQRVMRRHVGITGNRLTVGRIGLRT